MRLVRRQLEASLARNAVEAELVELCVVLCAKGERTNGGLEQVICFSCVLFFSLRRTLVIGANLDIVGIHRLGAAGALGGHGRRGVVVSEGEREK